MKISASSLYRLLQHKRINLWIWSLAYALVAYAYLAALVSNFQCGVGFTSMIAVGEHFYDQSLPEFKAAQPRVHEDSFGYDAQFYSQIALDPTLQDPDLDTAVDTLGYRARRILMPAFAWLLGAGDPKRIVNVYPLINPICWLLSALILLRWLPPTGIQNFIRWTGILLGWGWITSTERSLADGPAATLTLIAAWLVLRGSYARGALSLAASALAKDVSLVAGLALFEPKSSPRRALYSFVGRGILCVAPLLLWLTYVALQTPPQNASLLGSGNFALPFFELAAKLNGQWHAWSSGESAKAGFYFLCYVAIALHIVFILLRPDWKNVWWRIGIGFAVLGAVLGPAVWADEPGAAPRVLLTLHISFNLLVPKTRAWLPLLLLGNVSVFDFSPIMEPPELSRRSQICIERSMFLENSKEVDASWIELRFLDGWQQVETSGNRAWKWTEDEGVLEFFNHSALSVETDITLRLATHYDRETIVTWNGQELARFRQNLQLTDYPLGRISIEPGSNILTIGSDQPAQPPNNADTRRLGASLHRIFLYNEPKR